MKKRFALVGALAILTGIVAVWWIFQRQTEDESLVLESQATNPPAAIFPQVSTSQTRSAGGIEAGVQDVRKADEILDVLLHARPGSLTTKEAYQQVQDLIASPDFYKTVHVLLGSQDYTERLLAAYLLLEANGLTDELQYVAVNDSSPYVRAEIFNWLFRKHNFTDIDHLVQLSTPGLSSAVVTQIVLLASIEVQAKVSMPMSRLDLGEGLPLYLTFLAQSSPAVVSAISEVLSDKQAPASGKKLMLSILAAVRPPDYLDILQRDLETETTLSTRVLLSQHLAATASQTNDQVKAGINSRLPVMPPGIGPIVIKYREDRLDELHQIEQQLQARLNKQPPDLLGLDAGLSAYLETVRILGSECVSQDFLVSMSKTAIEHPVLLSRDAFAEAAFLQYESHKNVGAKP